MSKPSLMQTLLKRPSQTYSFPHEKEYFSTKNDMLRLAAESADPLRDVEASSSSSSATRSRTNLPGDNSPGFGYSKPLPPHNPQDWVMNGVTRGNRLGAGSEVRHNDAKSPAHRPRYTEATKFQTTSASGSTVRKKRSSSSRKSQRLSESFDDPEDSDSSQDVFYTPNTSPRTSMASSVAVVTTPFASLGPPETPPVPPIPQSTNPKAKLRRSQPFVIASDSKSIPSNSNISLTSTIVSTSAEGRSFSALSDTHSQLTDTDTITPIQSDDGHSKPTSPPSRDPGSQISSSTRRHTNGHDPSSVAVRATITKRVPVPTIDRQPGQSTPPHSSISSNTVSVDDKSVPSAAENNHRVPSRPLPTQSRRREMVNTPRRPKNMSKPPPNIMIGMDALIEEDEDTVSTRSRSIRNGRDGLYTYPGGRLSVARSDDQMIVEEDQLLPGSSTEDSESSNTRQIRHRRSRSLDYGSSTSKKFDSRFVPPVNYEEPAALPSHGTRGYSSLTLPRAPPPPSTALGNVSNAEGPTHLDGSGKIDLTKSGIAQTTMATVEVVRGLGRRSSRSKGWKLVKGLFGRQVADGNGVDLEFTSYRPPPNYVPARSILVQVWAVAMDEVDLRLLGLGIYDGARAYEPISNLNGRARQDTATNGHGNGHTPPPVPLDRKAAEVGYIPGRSFVGRVLECGWEIPEETFRRGEWVAGLLDARKCGALAEFIVVDRRRVHRVPYPNMDSTQSVQSYDALPNGNVNVASASKVDNVQQKYPRRLSRTPSTSSGSHMRHPSSDKSSAPERQPPMTLEELALLALTGIPAYRAVRTFQFAHASRSTSLSHNAMHPSSKPADEQRRVVVLKGHDGVGAMAVQMLVKDGWRVCVHAPLPKVDLDDGERNRQEAMLVIEERARLWGADEVIFDDGGLERESPAAKRTGPVVRVLQRLLEDGDVFEAVLDTVGGKDVWEASEKLLSIRLPSGQQAQFTTLVGDNPERPIPTAGDNFRAGVRNWKLGSSPRKGRLVRSASLSVSGSNGQAIDPSILPPEVIGKGKGKVEYAWVSLAQDVGWEGEDVGSSLAEVLRMALDMGIRPFVEEVDKIGSRTALFEKVPDLFREKGSIPTQILRDGGTVVVKVVE
ncbi:hypothetical protein PLEOSDRAFT_176054 [Pleurotus ostreatus PC15]|uniref:Uncharacterized protein n=1 Tax=Pleurotus ostreatus (strain PC15) TaxID=1137138 RepID=A0A067P0A8_PLEO1|nr:hypothetical protein PLEOSDRAFT_176054 [Pleurotus ostreatus PC15]